MKLLTLSLFTAALCAQVPPIVLTLPTPCGSPGNAVTLQAGTGSTARLTTNRCQADGTWLADITADQALTVPYPISDVSGLQAALDSKAAITSVPDPTVFKPAGNYVLTSFASLGPNDTSSDTLRLLISQSTDGRNFYLTSTSLYNDTYSVVRDPSIIFMAATGMWSIAYTCNASSSVGGTSHNVLCMIQGKDLANLSAWTRSTIDIPASMNTYTWAPEFFADNPGCTGASGYDQNGKACTAAQSVWIFYSAGTLLSGASHHMYAIKASDATLAAWTNGAGTANTADDTGLVGIDGAIWKNPLDNLFYQFYVRPAAGSNGNVQYGTSTTVNTGYSNVSTGDWTGQLNQGGVFAQNEFEAPTVTQISPTSLQLCTDHLQNVDKPFGIVCMRSSSLNMATATWSAPVSVGVPGGASNGLYDHHRHGTIYAARDGGAVANLNRISSPSVSLVPELSSFNIARSGSASTNVHQVSLNGYSGTVGLAANAPSGVTGSFSPGTLTTSGVSALTLSASSTAVSQASTGLLVGSNSELVRTVPVSVNVSGTGAFVTGSVNIAGPSSQPAASLTTLGPNGWLAFIDATNTASSASNIMTVTPVNPGSCATGGFQNFNLSWTNGQSPYVTMSSASGGFERLINCAVSTSGAGFSLTLNAPDTLSHVLTVYVASFNTDGIATATIGGATYSDSTGISTAGPNQTAAYTINFQAASVGQAFTFQILTTATGGHTGGGNNIAFSAAALN